MLVKISVIKQRMKVPQSILAWCSYQNHQGNNINVISNAINTGISSIALNVLYDANYKIF